MTETPYPGGSPPEGPAAAQRPTPRRNGMGVAALVVGTVGLVLAILFVFAPLGALLGLIAVIFGVVGLVRVNRGVADNRGQAIAGLSAGLAGLVIGVAISVSVGVFLAVHANDLNTFGNCLAKANSDQARQVCAQQFSNRVSK